MNRPAWLTRSSVQWAGLCAGPVLALLSYLLLPGTYTDSQGQTVALTHAARATAATGVWMAAWWITEAIPIYATALLPLALLPAAGAASVKAAAAPYGHELIYLFMGGFIIALAMERWGLHRRLAFVALRLVGDRPRNMIGGFMLATAGLSMWVSNTATTIMMLPIALSVIDLVHEQMTSDTAGRAHQWRGDDAHNFVRCLLLGIAYAASIGGIGTLIGTPPNLFLAAYVKNDLGLEISFVRWMAIGVPLVVVFLPLAWLLLTRALYPVRATRLEGAAAFARPAHASLGRMNTGERVTLIVFALTALLWIMRPLLAGIEWHGAQPFAGLTDTGIAIIAALALFVIPVDFGRRVFAMDWETAVKLPWGLLVLFGGGLSLAAAIEANGVAEFLGSQVGVLAGMPGVAIVLLVTALVIHLTEITSNTATTATLVPLLSALAPALGVHPYLLIVPAAIAASCAFMLPVATPPNAIIFGSGYVTIPQMCKAGLWLNLAGILLITALTYAIAMPLLGVDAGFGSRLP